MVTFKTMFQAEGIFRRIRPVILLPVGVLPVGVLPVGVLLVGLLLVGGCGGSNLSSSETEDPVGYLASVYNPSRLSLHPDYSLFHESDQFSILYIRAYPRELRFSATNEESEYRAMLRISYKLIQLEEPGMQGEVVDSAAITYKLNDRHEKQPAFFASLNLPVPGGNRYLLRVEARDVNRGSIGLEYLYVDKTNPYNGQNFKVVSASSGYPKFMRFFLPGEQFTIQHREKGTDTMFVDFFRIHSELPRPPVNASVEYTMNFSPDTSYTIATTDTSHYVLPERGRYHVRTHPDREEGLSLFNFGGSFPQVKTPGELMEPLFYLATLAEYRDLRTDNNRKLAVDKFWLKMGGSVEKSRELIRIYYNRVVYSNLYFTSNKEGWKTDQGMIFILFGPPARIQMTGTGERWYYYAKRRSTPVEFRFDRKPDVLLDQNLQWVKTTDSQMLWNDAVRSWRNGRVYSTNN